jgi:hypothetical protein
VEENLQCARQGDMGTLYAMEGVDGVSECVRVHRELVCECVRAHSELQGKCIENNDSNPDRSKIIIQGECSYRRLVRRGSWRPTDMESIA